LACCLPLSVGGRCCRRGEWRVMMIIWGTLGHQANHFLAGSLSDSEWKALRINFLGMLLAFMCCMETALYKKVQTPRQLLAYRFGLSRPQPLSTGRFSIISLADGRPASSSNRPANPFPCSTRKEKRTRDNGRHPHSLKFMYSSASNRRLSCRSAPCSAW